MLGACDAKHRSAGENRRYHEIAIQHCSDSGNYEAADAMIEKMLICCKDVNTFQYGVLLETFWKRGQYERMIAIYEDINQRGIQPSYNVFLYMLRAAFETERFEMILHIYEQMSGIGMEVENEDHLFQFLSQSSFSLYFK